MSGGRYPLIHDAFSSKTTTMYIRSIAIAGLITGILFKTLHWPGANALVLISAVITIATLAITFVKQRDTWSIQLPFPRVLMGALMAVVCGALFKVMHWPGANLLLLIGLSGCAIWFLVPPKVKAAA